MKSFPRFYTWKSSLWYTYINNKKLYVVLEGMDHYHEIQDKIDDNLHHDHCTAFIVDGYRILYYRWLSGKLAAGI